MYTVNMNFSGLEKLSLVDFDGVVACTLFTSGCNFRCGFCHNSPLVLKENLEEIIEEEIFSYLEKRKHVIEGVCISGGEPTMEKNLPEFIQKLKQKGLKVKLDTNGTNPEMLQNLLSEKLIDYVAMDIKSDKQTYSNVIGIKNYNTASVEKSVNILLNSKLEYEFRTTLIKEFHTKEVIENISSWIKGAKKYALQKYVYRDTCLGNKLSLVEKEKAEEFKAILSKNIQTVILRGY